MVLPGSPWVPRCRLESRRADGSSPPVVPASAWGHSIGLLGSHRRPLYRWFCAVRDLLGSINVEALPCDGQSFGHRPARPTPDRHQPTSRLAGRRTPRRRTSPRRVWFAAAVFDGPGEVRGLLRSVDWAATPLGAVDAVLVGEIERAVRTCRGRCAPLAPCFAGLAVAAKRTPAMAR